MHTFTKQFQPTLSKKACEVRKNRKYSQSRMAEYLHIDTRSYCDLEHGRYCLSAPTLILLELMMTEVELLLFLHELQEVVQELERV